MCGYIVSIDDLDEILHFSKLDRFHTLSEHQKLRISEFISKELVTTSKDKLSKSRNTDTIKACSLTSIETVAIKIMYTNEYQLTSSK